MTLKELSANEPAQPSHVAKWEDGWFAGKLPVVAVVPVICVVSLESALRNEAASKVAVGRVDNPCV